MVVGASLRMSGHEMTTMSEPDRLPQRAGRAVTTVAEMLFQDGRLLAADLQRLESHYRDEAARLKADAEDAQKAAHACSRWRRNLAAYEVS